MTNIGYILNSEKIGGGNRSMEILMKHITSFDMAPYVVCPRYGPMAELVKSMNIPVKIYSLEQPGWMSPINTYKNHRIWTNFIRSNNVSIIHANDLHSCRSVMLTAFYCDTPVVCHVRYPLPEKYCDWVFRSLPKPYGFVFNSNNLIETMGPRIRKSCPRSNQWVVHNAVDISKFCVTSCINDNPRIGIIANFQTVKGHEDFLDMASMLIKKRDNVTYEVVGDDIHNTGRKNELIDYVKKLDIETHVKFHGHTNQVENILKYLDIVVCPSHVEPFGRCIIEAMACGKPVVATRVGGIPEVVEDSKTGILVPPHSPQLLADAVEFLIENESIRKQMGRNGRERVEKIFTIRTHVESIYKIYEEIMK